MIDQISRPHDTPKIDPTIRLDEALLVAARTDCARLKQDYCDAVAALSKLSGGEEEQRQRYVRADRARAMLAQALTILDYARGDAVVQQG